MIQKTMSTTPMTIWHVTTAM